MTGKVLNGNSTGILILIIPVATAIILLYKAWPALLVFLLLIILWRIWDTYQWKQWCQELNPFFNQLVKENQGCLTPMDFSLKTNLSGKASKRFLERKAEEYGALRKDQGEQGIVYYFLTATALGSIFDDSEPEALPASDRPLLAFNPEVQDVKEETPSLVKVTEVEEKTGITSEPVAINTESPYSSAFAQLAALKEERQQTPEVSQVNSEVAAVELEDENPEELDSSPVEIRDEVDQTLSKGLIQADLAKRLDLNPSTLGRRKSDPDFAQWSQSKDPEGVAWKYLRKTRLFVPIESN